MIYLREGNEYAFRFIFDKYYDFLCMVADSYLRDEYISETIVGDIIYNLWEIKDNIDIKYSLRSYLVRSVKNRCINYLQQEYIQREISISDYPFMHLLYSQLLVCQRVCLQNTVCLICK